MPYHIFHQNLRVFGGGTDDRNKLFKRACEEIADDIGNDRIIVAAFTEVMNDNSTASALKKFAQKLDPALRTPMLFATGITAVGGKTEWVGISLYSALKLQIAGKVLKLTDNTWRAYPTTQVASNVLPSDNFAADVRGLAYVGGTFNGQNLLFGFMHNNYTLGEPGTIYRALPRMVQAIGQAHPGWDQVTFYLGGDFNLYPSNINVNFQAIRAEDNNGDAINTTFHHPYDFWVTNDANVSHDDAQVFTQSRWENDARLSDHAGVTLQIA